MTRFAHAVREELWAGGRLIESRLSHGEAVDQPDGSILAIDARDDVLVARSEELLVRLREAMPAIEDGRVRLVAEASTDGDRATMTVRQSWLSIVSTPEHIQRDLKVLREARACNWGSSRRYPRNEPFLWMDGSAAVLLHEAVGHPLEHDLPPLPLPDWLEVEIPLAFRRASFRDIPLRRMNRVSARLRNGAPFRLPWTDDADADHVEIYLVEGGSYDPLTDLVTIDVAASSIGDFRFVERRSDLLFLGGTGETRRYPGVICSREGQELVVESEAPMLLTGLR